MFGCAIFNELFNKQQTHCKKKKKCLYLLLCKIMYQKSTYTFNSLHFLVEISISDSKTPRNYIAFHTSYDYRGIIFINKDFYYGPLNA